MRRPKKRPFPEPETPSVPFYISNFGPYWKEEWEERAAILEFDAGLTRSRANMEAGKMVAERRLRVLNLVPPTCSSPAPTPP